MTSSTQGFLLTAFASLSGISGTFFMRKFDRARALSDALANIDAAVVGPLGPLAPLGPDAF